jgi:hypothetical protein
LRRRPGSLRRDPGASCPCRPAPSENPLEMSKRPGDMAFDGRPRGRRPAVAWEDLPWSAGTAALGRERPAPGPCGGPRSGAPGTPAGGEATALSPMPLQPRFLRGPQPPAAGGRAAILPASAPTAAGRRFPPASAPTAAGRRSPPPPPLRPQAGDPLLAPAGRRRSGPCGARRSRRGVSCHGAACGGLASLRREPPPRRVPPRLLGRYRRPRQLGLAATTPRRDVAGSRSPTAGGNVLPPVDAVGQGL